MRTCAEAGQADLDARINNNLIPADGTVPNSVKVKQFTEDARKDFKRARRMNE